MQIQNFAPAASATRTILLGRNRLNALAASFAPTFRMLESRAAAPRPSLSVRKNAGVTIAINAPGSAYPASARV